MKQVHIFSHSIDKYYIAPRWSCTYVFSLVCTVLTFVIPFYLCFSPRYGLHNNSQSFSFRDRSTIATPVGIWLKHDTYREQPKVQFQYKLLLAAQLKEKTRNDNIESMLHKELYYSTIHEVNELRAESFRSASTIAREVDDDLDGVMDRLLTTIKMPLEANEYVFGVQAIVLIHYRLEAHVKMEMDAMAYVHHGAGLPGSKLTSVGDLNLRQMVPIPITENLLSDDNGNKSLWKLYDDEQLLDLQSIKNNPTQSNLRQIIQKYHKRTITADYTERFVDWTRQVETSFVSNVNTTDELEEYTKEFELDLTIEIPKMQSVVYVPTLAEVLIEAWVRYLSLLVITGFFIRTLLKLLFTTHILKARPNVR